MERSRSRMPHDDRDMLTQAFWDERYGSRPQVWSGRPNPHLVDRVSGLTPGRAVDVGSGEGADALWLAQQGWAVTAIDVSPVALARGAEHAAAAGHDVAARISWRQEDVLRWGPEPGVFDLVTAHFMHLPSGPREELFARLAAGVAPGGSLLVVGHHPADHHEASHDDRRRLLFTAEEVAESLDDTAWDVVVAGAPQREVIREGEALTVTDAVLLARRAA
jgi:SAM-dependent methyltransferase